MNLAQPGRVSVALALGEERCGETRKIHPKAKGIVRWSGGIGVAPPLEKTGCHFRKIIV